MKNVTIAGYI